MSLRNTSYFNPTLISGCTLWLDGADPAGNGVVPAVGSTLSSWIDKSVTQNNFTGTNVTYTFDSTYGARSPTFNGNSEMAQTNTSLYSINNVSTLSFFCVSRNVGGGLATIYNGNTSTQTNYILYRYSSSTVQWYGGDAVSVYPVSTDGNGNGITSFIVNPSGTGTGYVNGTSFGSGGTSSSSGQAIFILGHQYTGGAYLTGYIYEFIIYNTALSTLQRQQIEGYLAWKWKLVSLLPSSHSYSLTPTFGLPSLVPNAPAKTTLTYANHPVVAINGCALWFDGADPLGTGSPPANGTSLTTWVNKGITPVTLAHGTSQPTYSANFQNGLGSVSFNNNYFSAAYSFNLQTKSAFIVCSQSNNATDSPQGILSFYGSGLDTVNSTNGYGYQATQGGYGSFGWLYNIFQGGSTGYYIATGTAGANTPMGIYGNVFSNQFEQTFKDGTSVTNFTISTTPGTSTNLMVGARLINGGLRGSFFGNICEIIVYNIALTAAQRQNIEGYLAQKWGLTANLPGAHPFKSSFPLFPAPVTTGVRRIAGRRWSPLTPGGCGLWLDGADSSTITLSSGVITQWNDKSGSGRNTTTIGGSPTFSSNFINLNGSSTYLVGPYTNTTEYLTMFVIATVDFSQGVYAYYYRLLSVGSTSANDYNSPSYASILHNPDSTQIGGYRNFATNFGSVTTNTTFLICLQYDGTNSTNFINGTSASSVASTGSFGTTSYSIGRDVGNTDGGGAYTYWPGKVGEVIIFNSSLSNTQRQQVEGYLAWKWGLKDSLPSSHPYKLFPPSP